MGSKFWWMKFLRFLWTGKWESLICVHCERGIHPHDDVHGTCLTTGCDCKTEIEE